MPAPPSGQVRFGTEFAIVCFTFCTYTCAQKTGATRRRVSSVVFACLMMTASEAAPASLIVPTSGNNDIVVQILNENTLIIRHTFRLT